MNVKRRVSNDELDDRNLSLIETQLDCLYRVSKQLSRSLDLQEMLDGVLGIFHEGLGMNFGMVTLLDPNGQGLLVRALHGGQSVDTSGIRYRAGEGILGSILSRQETVIIERISDEPEFLDRLGLYDANLGFIAVPVIVGDEQAIGVLAAQPGESTPADLALQARFLEMVSNLIARQVHLSIMITSERENLTSERDHLRREVRGNYGFENIVGSADCMKRIFDQVRQVAKWNTTVLIRGESGTGKELIANAIHYNSPRANGSFVKLNCAALPDNLLESELFGHEKGGFTGATSQRKGRFELADKGSIFLDEIGEISPVFQAKLLRVLQEGEFERVGGSQTLKVDVRIIAATNRDLETEVEEGRFREDLYYRLNVMLLNMPALRERPEDIPLLAEFLVAKLARAQGRELTITDSAIRVLVRHEWQGNVRELENCLERAAVLCGDGTIDFDTISLTGIEDRGGSISATPLRQLDFDDPEMDEREKVIAALEQAGWVQAKAARLLGMTPRQIAYRIQTLKIRVRQI